VTRSPGRRVRLKHERISRELAREIRSGRLRPGVRLPGEVALAERFGVSRTTVRAALAELSEGGLIATRTGKGSYVLYDGTPLDDPHGWARALASSGVDSRVRVLSVHAARAPELSAHLPDGAAVVVVERVREVADPAGPEPARAISYERATVPAVGPLADLPTRGLSGSLSAELAAAGLVADHGEQRAGCRALDQREAALLGWEPGAWVLHTRRTALTADDTLVERVESLLDPAHFELSLAFGPTGDA
jgi:GntR family transcriptional regulator